MLYPSKPLKVVCFANALLPDSDYRVSFARRSKNFDVTLALPDRPVEINPESFEQINVGPGLPFTSMREILRIPSILHRQRADIAMFFATQFSIFGPLLARIVRVRPVVTVTGLGRAFSAQGIKARVLQSVYVAAFKLNARLCSKILFQNEQDMRVLVSRLPSGLADRCVLIGSGIDLDYFRPGMIQKPTKASAVMVARLLPEKGIDDYLRLAVSLSPRADFTLIGPASDDHPEVLVKVLAASKEGSIHYLGQRTSCEVRDSLTEATVLVLPSRAEGLPRIALEAALSGVAVAAYDIPGCRAALGNDHPLVSVGNLEGLNSLVERLLSDEPFRARIVNSSKCFVESHLSADTYIRKLESVLN